MGLSECLSLAVIRLIPSLRLWFLPFGAAYGRLYPTGAVLLFRYIAVLYVADTQFFHCWAEITVLVVYAKNASLFALRYALYSHRVG